MTCDDSARMVIPHLNGPSPITTRSVSPAQVNPAISITNKVQNRQTVVVDIVKLRRGSGKDRQGMAVKAKGLKA